jgi:hypothetical protein
LFSGSHYPGVVTACPRKRTDILREVFSSLASPGGISALVHFIRLKRNDMHASRATDEKKDRCLHKDHATTMDLYHVGSSCFHGAADAMDRFSCATLTERVVSFLERYNQSAFGFR